MKVVLNLKSHTCTVTKEKGDPRFKRSEWASAESTFLHHVKKELIKQGHDVIKKRMAKDGHMMDDLQQYIRTRGPKSPAPHICIYNGSYAIYDAGERFNEDGEMTLHVETEIFILPDKRKPEEKVAHCLMGEN